MKRGQICLRRLSQIALLGAAFSMIGGCMASGEPAKPYAAEVSLDLGASGRPVNARVLGNNVQWVDHGDELLLRDEARPGFSSAMLDKVRNLKPPILRYPGGSLADLYHWRDGMGARGARRENEHFYSHARQKVAMGTQEFLELCEAVGAEPLITVNTASGDATEAAEWVKAVNVTGLTSRLTGRRLPRVQYWEIGNEPYLRDDKQKRLWLTPEAFAQKVNGFVRQMREVDGSIQVGIPLRSDSIGGQPATPVPGFNAKLLKQVTEKIDFVALHNAYLPLALDRKYDDRALYWGAMAAFRVVEADFAQTRGQLAQLLRGGAVPLAVTEYNALFSLGGRDSDEYVATQAGAVLVADMIRLFAQTPDMMLANFWSLSGNWHFGAVSNQGAIRPTYHVLRLYRELLNGREVPLAIRGPQVDTERVGYVSAQRAIPLVSGMATRENNVARISLINKDPERPAEINLKVLDGRAARYQLGTLKSDEPFARNPVWESREGAAIADNGTRLALTLPPHSVSLLTLTLKP